jgi:predicted nucleotidyltransferase
VIAVLFGSVLRRKLVRDLDIGVYFRSEESLTDVIDLSNMLEDELKLPVDVVPLRRAPPKLRLKALMGGGQACRARQPALLESSWTGFLRGNGC